MKKILFSVAFIALSFTSFAQVGVGTTNPDTSAALDVVSTTKGFLLPRMTEVQMNAIATPAEGLIVYCLDCTLKGLYVNIGTEFINVINGTSASADVVAAIVTASTNPAAGGTPSLADLTAAGVTGALGDQVAYEVAIADASPAPKTVAELQAIIDAVNNATPKDTTTAVVDVAGQNGTIWMDRNLGATQVATSSTDAAAYGDLYQWGRAADGHQIRTSTTAGGPVASGSEGQNFIITNYDWLSTKDDTLWQAGNNDPCPTGYRVPTETELNNERLAFAPNNGSGAYGSALKFTLAGNRSNSAGTLGSVGAGGYYWTSTVISDAVNDNNVRYMAIWSSGSGMNTTFRGRGYSVRCIKE